MKWLRVVALGLAGLGLVVRFGAVAGAALMNAAMLRLMAMPRCDPGWFLCAHSAATIWYPPQPLAANTEPVAEALGLLRQAAQLNPSARRVYLHRAEIQFYKDNRQEASDLLRAGGWSLPYLDVSTVDHGELRAGSPLLTIGRYEGHLMAGYHEMAVEHWPEAKAQLSIALAIAGERATEEDRRVFYLAAAQQHLLAASAGAREELLAGKYFVLADDLEQATRVLRPLMDDERLTGPEQAWAAFYLGRALQARGDEVGAMEAFRLGWDKSQEVRLNGISLVQLLRAKGQAAEAGVVADQLVSLGPAFASGRTADGYRLPTIATLPSGVVFAGYDADPQMVGDSAVFEAWLWWQAEDASLSSASQLMPVGSYLLQPQLLNNIVPNHNFEWGVGVSGVPYGWGFRIYNDDPASFSVIDIEREGSRTHVAQASNQSGDSSGLWGRTVPVQSDGWYLMAGLMNDTGNGNFGRNCQGPDSPLGEPYFIAYSDEAPIRPAGEWVQVVDLAPAAPDAAPYRCQLLLSNYQAPGGVTLWDDLVLARIEIPE